MRAALPNMDNAGGSELCGKGTCQVYDHIITTNTFTTIACGEVFKIQSGPLNCNSENLLYLLRCKICDDTPCVGKDETKLRLRFDGWEVTLFGKCKRHKQIKERETFWQHKLKTFYPLGLNEKKKNIYFNHTQYIIF